MFNLSKTLPCAPGALALVGASGAWASDFYKQRDLVSDSGLIRADHQDPHLVNAWGLAFNPFGFAWVVDNGTGFSTLYDGDGKPQSLVVTIRGTGKASGNPTGTAFYGGPGFIICKPGGMPASSRFLFVSEDGGIFGWAPTVEITDAIRVIDNEAGQALYKGVARSTLTISPPGTGSAGSRERTTSRSPSRDCGASPLAMACPTSRLTPCSSPPAPTMSSTGCMGA